MYKKISHKHSIFVYESFNVNENSQEIIFSFKFKIAPNIVFNPSIIFPSSKTIKIDEAVLSNVAFHLGLAEIPSYWKATCSPKIIIKAGYLNKKQLAFWRRVIVKGLGEFFYRNKIDFTVKNFLSIESVGNNKNKMFKGKVENRTLVPVGGGKDSIVTMELNRQKGKKFNCLLLNPTRAALSVAKIGGCKNPIIVKRTIDKKLLELNKKGYLNGHVPFSAHLAFVSLTGAILYNFKKIALSNEQSANEGNLLWKKHLINHQWSKTLEFEKMFQKYSQEFLSHDHYYFSELREFTELQIIEQFSHYPQYFKYFRSCNRGSKENVWCGKCPKCLFVFLLLNPFVSDKELINIFGHNLLTDKTLLPIAEQLAGISGNKPFECVGTKKEIRSAIQMGLQKAVKPPYILRQLAEV